MPANLFCSFHWVLIDTISSRGSQAPISVLALRVPSLVFRPSCCIIMIVDAEKGFSWRYADTPPPPGVKGAPGIEAAFACD